MLSNAGTVTFGYNYTSTSNSGTGSAIGNYPTYCIEQQVFRKTGSGVYADNNYYIMAKEVNATTIEFLSQMDEADTGNTSGAKGVQPVDEFVVGRLTTSIGFVRASGSYVDVDAPTFTNSIPTFPQLMLDFFQFYHIILLYGEIMDQRSKKVLNTLTMLQHLKIKKER